MSRVPEDIKPVLPKNGQLILEDTQELHMCKPRLIPLKSFTLEKLEKMQQIVRDIQEQSSTTNKLEN